MLKIMGKYSKGYWFYTIITPIIMIVEVFLEVLIPTLMVYIVDVAGQIAIGNYVPGSESTAFIDGIIQNNPNFMTGTTLLWTLGGLSLLVAILALTFGALAGRTVAIAGAGFASNLRNGLFEKVQSFSFANIDKFSTAGLVTRCTTDVTNTQQAYMMMLRIVIRAPLMMIMATVMALQLNKSVAFIYLIAIPILGVIMAVGVVFTFPRFKKMLKLYDQMNNDIQENLIASRVVKAYVREDFEVQKYDKTAQQVRVAHLGAEKVIVLSQPFAMVVMYMVIVAIVSIGGGQIIDGQMKAGALTGLINYSMQIMMSVMMVTFVIVQMVLSRASITRIREALDEETDIVDGTSDHIVGSGKIEFKNVDFSYSKNPDNLTLSKINLNIESGQRIGVVGGTGEGKTSLVQLIPRFYDVYDGEVLVDGVDVRDYKLEALRDGVSMVLQKNVLFSGTIEENLRWGNENATTEQIETAAKAAQAHDFVMSFPDGYQTDLGQGGVNVSGGQKQRLCIARTLLKNPKIIILDDSTSAVDTATDASIRAELQKTFKDLTVITIAQRISSIEDCDQIIVLDEGQINGVGKHKELLKSNKIYQEVYNSQQKGEDK